MDEDDNGDDNNDDSDADNDEDDDDRGDDIGIAIVGSGDFDNDIEDDDEGDWGYSILGSNCPVEGIVLVRKMDRAAPQSMKTKAAPFHNFILERGGALKLCQREKQNELVRHVSTEQHL